MPERCHDPALNPLDCDLHLGLVAGLADSGRQDREPIVLGKVLVAGVKIRLIAARLMHAALEVVGHDRPRHTTEVLERSDMGRQPIGHTLAEARLHIRVVARAEGGDKHLRDLHLAGVSINHRHRLAGVIDKQLVPGRVLKAHYGILPPEPALVVAAKGTVLAAIRVLGLVLAPQEHARHALVRELALHLGKVRRGIGRWLRRSRIKTRPQRLFVPLLGQGPGHAGRARPAQALLHRRAGRAQHSGDLPVTELRLGLEPQHLTNLTHGQPRLRHRPPPREKPEKVTVT